MLAGLFVAFFGPRGAGDGEYKRKLPRFLVSTRKLRKVYEKLQAAPATKATVEAIARPFVEVSAPAATPAPVLPNFALMARDEAAVDRLLELLREQEENEAFMVMLGWM